MSVGISNNINTQKKPAFCGSKAMQQANRWKRSLKHFVDVADSPVSNSFVKEMAQGVDSLGIVGKKIIKKQNTECRLAQKATDAFPELRGKHCPGYPKGTTWDNVAALSDKRRIGLFEKPFGKILSEGKPPASVNEVRHEIGHQLHALFKKIIGIEFIDTKGFTKVYLQDLENLKKHPEILDKYSGKTRMSKFYKQFFPNRNPNPKDRAKSQIDYLIQGSTPINATYDGKCEVFATIFAKLYRKDDQKDYYHTGLDKLIEKVFPNTIAYVEKLLWLLGKR